MRMRRHQRQKPRVKADNPFLLLRSEIDKYDADMSSADANKKALELLGDRGYEALHEFDSTKRQYKTTTQDNKTARTLFLEKLAEIYENGKTVDLSKGDFREDDPESYLVTMKELLGSYGLKLYHDAIEEERNSAAFRNAVFLQSTTHHDGPKWKKRLVLWVGGPSASGKSFASDALVDYVGTEVMERDDTDLSGNTIVSIDGGTEREVSQMRQLLLQLALQKGYPGIDDLHDETKLKMKRKIQEAVVQNPNLHVVIPDTFVSGLRESTINKFAKDDNVQQVFSKVVGGETEPEKQRFKRSVMRMGNSRAWSSEFNDEHTKDRKITINNLHIGCESKRYDPFNFFLGKWRSARARRAYMRAQAKHNRDCVYLTVTNDRVFLRKEGNEWVECSKNEKSKRALFARAYRQYKEDNQAKIISLPALYKKLKKEKQEKPLALPERAFKQWQRAVKEGRISDDLPAWWEANKDQYRSAKIDLEINNQKIQRTPPTEPNLSQTLGFMLMSQLADAKSHDSAIDSLFEIANTLDPRARAAFYQALKNKFAISLELTPGVAETDIIYLYTKLADAQDALHRAQHDLAVFNQVERKLPLKKIKELEAVIAASQAEIAACKMQLKNFKQEDFLTRLKTTATSLDHEIWREVIEAIPADPINRNNLFLQPVSFVPTDSPRQGDLRRYMSRDMRHYRYVAPKGEGGAQQAGPFGGWYVGCYQTPDGKIHTQRVMIKRESCFRKNIIESLCGRLKASLVNQQHDFVANTYLVRDPTKPRTGANVYAVSLAFDDFTETHKLAGLDHRVKMAGTRKKYFGGDAKRVYDKISELHDVENYDGLEEALIASWWTKDSDVHSGNIGFSERLKQFLNIDHAGGMIWLDGKIHPNRQGLWHNMIRAMRPVLYFWDEDRRSPEPTYHAAEYSEAVRCSERMAQAIRNTAGVMTIETINEVIDDEINTGVENYRDDPNEFRRMVKRIGVDDSLLPKDDIDVCADVAKGFLKEIMYARLVNMRQFGMEIELSLCFTYNPALKRFEADDVKLTQFILANPNYCLENKHHFRGDSHGHSRSFLYHVFHNKRWVSGESYNLQQLLEDKTREVLKGENEGITPFLKEDFNIKNQSARAHNYLTRLHFMKEILEKDGLLNGNPLLSKLAECMFYLDQYSSPEYKKSRRQHLVKICDDAYLLIQNLYAHAPQETQENIVRVFTELQNKGSMQYYNNLYQINPYHQQRDQLISDEFFEAVSLDQLKVAEIAEAKYADDDDLPLFDAPSVYEEELKPADRGIKQLYHTTTVTLEKEPGKTFIQQTAEHFSQPQPSPLGNIAAISEKRTTIGEAATPDKAIILENPANKTGAGALLVKEQGRTKLVDFEDPNVSFENILAQEILKMSPQIGARFSQDDLRDLIKTNYIDKLQRFKPPEIVTKNNLYQHLILPLIHDGILTLPPNSGRFFSKSFVNDEKAFANKLYEHFSNVMYWNQDVLNMAKIWYETFKAEKIPPHKIILENVCGNPEQARLFLLILAAKGANLEKVNHTGYKFNEEPFSISPAEIKRMKKYLAGFELSREEEKVLSEIKSRLFHVKQEAVSADGPKLIQMIKKLESDQTQLLALQKKAHHKDPFEDLAYDLRQTLGVLKQRLDLTPAGQLRKLSS